MAEYQLTPYVVQVYPSGAPDSPMKMGRASLGKDPISVLNAITNTFIALSREERPRKRPNVRNRKLKVISVKWNDTQVEATCRLGVSGYVSQMNLKELGVSAQRDADDDEWFDLRVVFAAIPTVRAGLLLIEGVGNYGIVTAVSELLKSAFRQNLAGVTLKVKPVQDAQAWAETFGGLSTQALEFHTLIHPDDVADAAPSGGIHRPLTKIIKIKRRGGLGSFKALSGKTLQEVADIYGIGNDIDDDTWATATLGGPGTRPRKINIGDQKVSSISFPITRQSTKAAPTPAEFYAVANKVTVDVRPGLGLGTLNVSAPTQADTRTIETTDAANWTVPNEANADGSDHGPAQDAP